MLTDLGLTDLVITLLRIQEFGLMPALGSIFLVYPYIWGLRLMILFAIMGPDNDYLDTVFWGIELERHRDSPFRMCLVYVLTVVPESLWLDASFALTLRGPVAGMMACGLAILLNVLCPLRV
ncbi:hypothetical protein LTR15_011395 [Elasticomyces elasticus]|nr:hypothetical protein LTR15_011395 [Elasticomyces elasticus]